MWFVLNYLIVKVNKMKILLMFIIKLIQLIKSNLKIFRNS